MMRWVVRRVRTAGLLGASVAALGACSKDDAGGAGGAGSKTVDASPPPPAAPKNLDLARSALVSAKAKYARHEVVDAECAPIKSLEADFAKDTTPDAVKTTREIDVFCEIDVTLEGAVATLKTDNDKLAAAVKKKDHGTEQMYAATVKDGCESIRKQLETLATEKLDGEPKVATLKAQVDPICAPPAAARKK